MNGRASLLYGIALGTVALSHVARSAAADRPAASLAHVTDPGATAGRGDGVYGRYSGDLAYRFALGIEWDAQAKATRPLIVAELVGYQTIGVYLSYRQGLTKHDEVENVISFGATFSPLFFLRWSKAAELGYPHLDLMIDSLTIAPGLALSTPPSGPFAGSVGLELGFGAGVPILPRADGPWIRARFNLLSARRSLGFDSEWGSSLFVYVEWQGFFNAGLLRTGER